MTDTAPTPILVSRSALQPILTAIARQAITAAGTALVAKGIVSQGQVDAAIPGIADQAVGLLMVAASAGWAWWKANHTHGQLVTVAGSDKVPDDVAALKG